MTILKFGSLKPGGSILRPEKKKAEEIFHQPVLLKEVIRFLEVEPGEKYIDATVGGGGHAIEILKKGGMVLGIDCDPKAIEATGERIRGLEKWTSRKRVVLLRGNFAHLRDIAQRHGFDQVGGVVFDLGVSTHQFLTPERGFSFQSDAPLDMRMDPELKVTAGDLINGLRKEELYELFSKLGEEKFALGIARAIVRARSLKPIVTCKELARIIVGAVPERKPKIHPATRCFQALRIAVNDELDNLKTALPQAVSLLKPKGRVVVLSFHSLEDRIVKNFLRERKDLQILTKKPIVPTQKEKERNPKSRSAKMRVGEKIKISNF